MMFWLFLNPRSLSDCTLNLWRWSQSRTVIILVTYSILVVIWSAAQPANDPNTVVIMRKIQYRCHLLCGFRRDCRGCTLGMHSRLTTRALTTKCGPNSVGRQQWENLGNGRRPDPGKPRVRRIRKLDVLHFWLCAAAWCIPLAVAHRWMPPSATRRPLQAVEHLENNSTGLSSRANGLLDDADED